MRSRSTHLTIAACAAALLAPQLAHAQEIESGDTAWMLVSTTLVLLMTIPGLSLFYAGLVRRRNVLSVLMQCLALTSMITILWLVFGYSVAFDTTGMVKGEVTQNAFVGSLVKAFLWCTSPRAWRRWWRRS
jgi:Amt family ammonium transporter